MKIKIPGLPPGEINQAELLALILIELKEIKNKLDLL